MVAPDGSAGQEVPQVSIGGLKSCVWGAQSYVPIREPRQYGPSARKFRLSFQTRHSSTCWNITLHDKQHRRQYLAWSKNAIN